MTSRRVATTGKRWVDRTCVDAREPVRVLLMTEG